MFLKVVLSSLMGNQFCLYWEVLGISNRANYLKFEADLLGWKKKGTNLSNPFSCFLVLLFLFSVFEVPPGCFVLILKRSWKPKTECCFIVSFSRAPITKHCRLSGLNNRHLFHHSCGGWKSKIKVSSGLVSYETSLFEL